MQDNEKEYRSRALYAKWSFDLEFRHKEPFEQYIIDTGLHEGDPRNIKILVYLNQKLPDGIVLPENYRGFGVFQAVPISIPS